MNFKIIISLLVVLLTAKDAIADDEFKPQRVQSIRQNNIATFENLSGLLNAKRYDEAIVALDAINASEYNNVETSHLHQFYGQVYSAKKQPEKAIAAFQRSIQLTEGLPRNFVSQIEDVLLPKLVAAFNRHSETYARLQPSMSNAEFALNNEHGQYAKAAYELGKQKEAATLMALAEAQYESETLPKVWMSLKHDMVIDGSSDIEQSITLRKHEMDIYPSRDTGLQLLELYDTLHKNGPSDSLTRTRNIQNLLTTLDAMYAQALLEQGSDFELYLQALFLDDRYEDLLQVYAQNLEAFEPNNSLLRARATAAFELQQWELATVLLNELNDKGLDKRGVYRLQLATAYEELKQFEKAEAVYEELSENRTLEHAAKQKLKDLKKRERKHRKQQGRE